MEQLIGIMVLIWLLAAPLLAGLFAGTPRQNAIAVVSLLSVGGLALVLTAIFGWPFGTCYTDGGCWEGLILLPVYASLVLTAAIFALAAFLRRGVRGREEQQSAIAAATNPAETVHLQSQVKE